MNIREIDCILEPIITNTGTSEMTDINQELTVLYYHKSEHDVTKG